MNQNRKQVVLVLVVVLIIGAIWYLNSQKLMQSASNQAGIDLMSDSHMATGTRAVSIEQKEKKYSRAKELAGIAGYINTPEFKLADLIEKKVILIDFWAYSCINCQRTTPYLNSWYAKYKDKGFAIVGVHTPEFDFEKDMVNVARAVKEARIQYPIVLDNNYGTWNAYNNRYWPHELLIDIDGFIVHEQIGEGGYDETEKIIQDLLKERSLVLGDQMKINEAITVPNKDDIEVGSPETYFGSERNEFLANGVQGSSGQQNFTSPKSVDLNKLYLVGKWNIKDQYAQSVATVNSPSKIEYRYNAKRAYFVAGSSGGSITVEVLRDGKPIDTSAKGADIYFKDEKSYVDVKENKLYKIIEDSAMSEHTLEFIVTNPGLQAYTFTFG